MPFEQISAWLEHSATMQTKVDTIFSKPTRMAAGSDRVAWDYIIVGAGSAGCVLANRLTENPATRVLLLESGPSDRHPYLHIPKGFGKILASARHTWSFPIEPEAGGDRQEVWPRGRTLGGSSAINGMMYVRGHNADYDGWEAAGATGWGAQAMRRCFRAIEHCAASGEAGHQGGPLHVTTRPPDSLPVCDALVAAGVEAGLPEKTDLNEDASQGIGYLPATIHNGIRWSAARAFLSPAKPRRNLRIVTQATVSRILFEGRHAVGVRVRGPDGGTLDYFGAETILCAGAIQSPKLLQLSGVGPAGHLAALGIPVVHDSPAVGSNLLEHRLLGFQFRISKGGYNAALRGVGLARSMAHYLIARRGALSTGAYQVGAFVKTLPGADRPDCELLMGPYTVDPLGKGFTMERQPGLRIIGFPLRPRSQGSVLIRSADPDDTPRIRPNFLSDPYDQDVSIRSVRFIRRLAAQPALHGLIVSELSPGASIETDSEIVDAFRQQGVAGMHATSTCRMGLDGMAVVGPDLRVHGLAGLSVMDCSVMPSMVSGNTNGPVMAMAWNAAEIIKAR